MKEHLYIICNVTGCAKPVEKGSDVCGYHNHIISDCEPLTAEVIRDVENIEFMLDPKINKKDRRPDA
jgi:hypothetical protein